MLVILWVFTGSYCKQTWRTACYLYDQKRTRARARVSVCVCVWILRLAFDIISMDNDRNVYSHKFVSV